MSKAILTTFLILIFAIPLHADENFFTPGRVWLDTDGRPIESHSAGILKIDDTYYWYGEDHQLGTGNKTGVCCYSSKDLHNWKNQGIVLPKDLMPEQYQDTGVCERPKVIYNPKTKKFVMWMHLDSDGYTTANAGVATCDSSTGKFKFLKYFRPINYDFGPPANDRLKQKELGGTYRDMNLFVDDDGAAYVLYSSEGNLTMYVARLNEDFTDIQRPAVKGKTWDRILVNESREAPAPFKHNGKYYMITSGLTGWTQNPAKYHVAENILGPWRTLGNPCIGPDNETTFFSQSTFVLPAPGKKPGSFIFLADRWNGYDLSKSTFVWLPFVMADDDTIMIENYDKWNLDVFDSAATPLTPPKPILKEKNVLTWQRVEGASGYRIFRNGKYIAITAALQYQLPPQLAGRLHNYTVSAITLLGVSSPPSIPVPVNSGLPRTTWLSEIKPDHWTQGFGFPRTDRAIENSPIKIVDKTFEKGIGSHAPSEIIYYTAGLYDRFTASVGCDAYPSFEDVSTVEFKVYGDGRLLFNSGVMRVKTPAKKVDVSIKNINELKLITTDAGDGQHWDHADWAIPKLIAQ